MFDFIIIGAGVIGSSIARELAHYKLKIAVIEKNSDVCEETSMANSAIVHSGYDPKPHTLKAMLNVRGNMLFDQLAKELNFEFKRIGSLTVALDKEEYQELFNLAKRGEENCVKTKILNKEELKALEPFVSDDAYGALYAPSCGIVNPFEYTVALMENAIDNGVELYLDNRVEDIKEIDGGYLVKTDKGEYKGRNVINAAGVYSGEIAKLIGDDDIHITPRKGEYYVLDHFEQPFVSHTIFPMPSKKGKGTLVTPTTHGNYLLGPTNVETDYDDKTTTPQGFASIRSSTQKIVRDIPFDQIIRSFAGIRAKEQDGDFKIFEEKDHPGFYNVAGIQSPGLASSPAIAAYVVELIKARNKLEFNPNFNPYRRPFIKLKELPIEEVHKLIEKDSRFGHIVCRCEKISEGEICDAIHRSCGARTIKGIKKRVRPGFGKCQGGFCEPLCVKILARELGVDPMDVKYGSKNSYILAKESKESEDK